MMLEVEQNAKAGSSSLEECLACWGYPGVEHCWSVDPEAPRFGSDVFFFLKTDKDTQLRANIDRR